MAAEEKTRLIAEGVFNNNANLIRGYGFDVARCQRLSTGVHEIVLAREINTNDGHMFQAFPSLSSSVYGIMITAAPTSFPTGDTFLLTTSRIELGTPPPDASLVDIFYYVSVREFIALPLTP